MYTIAGHDTTAHTAAWALFCLATEPHAQNQLQIELDAAFGPPRAAAQSPPLTAENVAALPVLGAVISESMRLFPVAAVGVVRVAPCDTLLPGGWLVRKGEAVRCGGFPAFCGEFEGGFKKPREFRLERWLPGAPPIPECWAPFASGPRGCAGQALAALQLRVIVSRLAHRFAVAFPEGAPPVEPVNGLTLHAKDGMHLVLTPRCER